MLPVLKDRVADIGLLLNFFCPGDSSAFFTVRIRGIFVATRNAVSLQPFRRVPFISYLPFSYLEKPSEFHKADASAVRSFTVLSVSIPSGADAPGLHCVFANAAGPANSPGSPYADHAIEFGGNRRQRYAGECFVGSFDG
jgi:hypothetical protein